MFPSGATPAPRRRSLWRVVPVLTVMVVVGCVTVVVLLSSGSQPPGPAPLPTPAVSSTTTVPPTSRSVARVPAGVALADQVSQDAEAVSNLAGAWVPQVSSKAMGTRADGIVYGESDIFRDFSRWRASYSNAVLLTSDRFPTFSGPGYWVTVIAQRYSTPDQANAWCDAESLPGDSCFAKLLATTPSSPSTVHR